MASTTMMTAEETEARWLQLHRRFAERLLASRGVREEPAGTGRKSHVDERLVQAIWSDQLLKFDALATASGKSVEIIEPGRWNTGRGPDFLDARIRVAGETLQGDVEIHVDSADWTRHKHHQDFEYNRVVLHVGLFAHDDRPYDEKQNGERLERLVIEDFLEPDLDTIKATLNLGDYPYGRPGDLGVCHEEFLRLPEDGLVEFLRIAGRSRVEQKIARFRAQLTTANFEQVIYQALMTGQGFKASKTLYFLLSKRAPFSELMEFARDHKAEDRTDFFLSVLLHVGSLVPIQPDAFADADAPTQEFVARLQSLWRPARPYFSDRLIPPTKRWYAGMRPAGFPTRRLAAVAHLLGRLGGGRQSLLADLAARIGGAEPASMKPKELRAYWRQLAGVLVIEEPEHYFSTHFTLGGKHQRPQSLLGEPAALSVLFNVLLPLLILKARMEKDRALEERAWRVVAGFPRLEENSVVKFMKRRLLGDDERYASMFRIEVFQQSLLKVFSDCCAHNERTCGDCTFLALADRMKTKNVQEAG